MTGKCQQYRVKATGFMIFMDITWHYMPCPSLPIKKRETKRQNAPHAEEGVSFLNAVPVIQKAPHAELAAQAIPPLTLAYACSCFYNIFGSRMLMFNLLRFFLADVFAICIHLEFCRFACCEAQFWRALLAGKMPGTPSVQEASKGVQWLSLPPTPPEH